MGLNEYSKAEFERLDAKGKATLCAALATLLLMRLRTEPDFHKGVGKLIGELRAVGHDLWSFDESDDMEAWCPNYESPSGPGIVLTFTHDRVEVDWSE